MKNTIEFGKSAAGTYILLRRDCSLSEFCVHLDTVGADDKENDLESKPFQRVHNLNGQSDL